MLYPVNISLLHKINKTKCYMMFNQNITYKHINI